MKIASATPGTAATTKTSPSRLATTVLLMLSALALLTPARSFVVQQAFATSRHLSPRRRGVRSALSLATTTTLRGGGAPYSTTTSLSMASGGGSDSKPFAVVVTAEIQPDRMEEFLEMIQFNAENSRQEPGCIRFGK